MAGKHFTPPNIRQATPKDYIPLCELFDEIDALHRDKLPGMFQKTDGPVRERAYYLSIVADENIGFFIAEAGPGLVGFVHTIFRDAPTFPVFVPRKIAVVDSLVVKAGFRQQGLGEMLMDKAQEWAIAKGATSMELNVYEFNQTAISFYERLGYQTYSRRMQKELKLDE